MKTIYFGVRPEQLDRLESYRWGAEMKFATTSETLLQMRCGIDPESYEAVLMVAADDPSMHDSFLGDGFEEKMLLCESEKGTEEGPRDLMRYLYLSALELGGFSDLFEKSLEKIGWTRENYEKALPEHAVREGEALSWPER